MLEDVDALEALRPVVEILLVAELAVLEPVVAPLDAAVVPPVQRLEPALVAPERQELDVVDAAGRSWCAPLRRVAVREISTDVVAHLVEQRLRVGEEHQVGVEVGDLRRAPARVSKQ